MPSHVTQARSDFHLPPPGSNGSQIRLSPRRCQARIPCQHSGGTRWFRHNLRPYSGGYIVNRDRLTCLLNHLRHSPGQTQPRISCYQAKHWRVCLKMAFFFSFRRISSRVSVIPGVYFENGPSLRNLYRKGRKKKAFSFFQIYITVKFKMCKYLGPRSLPIAGFAALKPCRA